MAFIDLAGFKAAVLENQAEIETRFSHKKTELHCGIDTKTDANFFGMQHK